MRYDTIIIGGGLSGLTAGIYLARTGKRVCIVSSGQSSLHFHSGSFDLLGYDPQGNTIERPLEAVSRLNAQHPYHKLGTEKVGYLAEKAKRLLTEIGLKLKGSAETNHYRFTPIGKMIPTWLTLDEYATSENLKTMPWKKVEVLNIQGFMDFPTPFISNHLKKLSISCQVKSFTTDTLRYLRKSPTEMRATNIAKVLSNKDSLHQVADTINAVSGDADVTLLPAVLGFNNDNDVQLLSSWVEKPIKFVATLPPSISGVRISNILKHSFTSLGGTILVGDKVIGGQFDNDKLLSVVTANLPDEHLYAENFILATGSFLSHGLQSNYEKVFEPIFDLDLNATNNREEWSCEDAFEAQPYMEFGVKTNANFQTLKNGKAITNLFAIGSVLCGHNSIKLADGEGTSLLTALHVAETITERK